MELENTKQGESLCCVYAAYAGGRGLSRGNDSAMDGWIWVLLTPGRSHVSSRIAKGNRTAIAINDRYILSWGRVAPGPYSPKSRVHHT